MIGVGFLMADALDTVAKQFPDTHFAGIDCRSGDAASRKPKNFAACSSRSRRRATSSATSPAAREAQGAGPASRSISSVGGQKIPPVDRYIAGYQAGAKKADPGIKILNAYSQDFIDQASARRSRWTRSPRARDVMFQVAGGCGLGALDAAKDKDIWGIGVDADQAYLGAAHPHERA